MDALGEAEEYELFGYPATAIRDSDFLEDTFSTFGHEVYDILDLACGTGRHALEMAKRGYSVTGVDISEDMLRLATRKASAQNLRIRFLQKDIAKLDFKEQFDAAYILFNTVSLLTRNEDILGFFKGVHKSLKKGGLLVIEVGNMWSYIAEGTFHNMSGERDEEREGIGRRINVKTAIGPYNNVYCHESASRYWRNSEELQLRTRIDCTRIFSVNEFGLLCRLTAFEILGIFGSTDFSKKIENPHIIEVVEKPYHGFVLVLSKRE